MGLGFCILLYPIDKSWVGTPGFLEGVASLLGADTLKSMVVYRETSFLPGGGSSPAETSKKILELHGVPVAEGIARQRSDPGYSTSLDFDHPPLLAAIGQEVLATLPEDLSEGAIPLGITLANGRWKHHDHNEGEQTAEGQCRLAFVNRLGYPVELNDYLQAFMQVESVVRLRNHLEELSGRPWQALIDLA